MDRHEQLLVTLKRALATAQLNYRQLAERIGMSESGVKKLLTGDDISLSRLQQICDAIGVSLVDVIEASRHEAIRDVELSHDQQCYFLDHPATFAFFWRLFVERRSVAEIKRRDGLSNAQARRHLSALSRLGLLELGAGDRIRLRDDDLVRWSDRGPLMDHLNQRWSVELVEECLARLRGDPEGVERGGGSVSRAASAQHLFRLHQLMLRPETASELKSEFERLIDEFRRRARHELLTSDRTALIAVSLLTALAPRSFVPEIPAANAPRSRRRTGREG